jgi:hypothetical protein
MRDEAARRGVAEAEIRLWRSEAGHIDAASLAAPERLIAPIEDDGKNLGKAIKAYAELVKINPF